MKVYPLFLAYHHMLYLMPILYAGKRNGGRHPKCNSSSTDSRIIQLRRLVQYTAYKPYILTSLTFASLSVSASPPLQLVQICAEHYLTSEHRSVRMEAVKTCAALLVPSLLPPSIFTTPFVQFSQASAQVTSGVQLILPLTLALYCVTRNHVLQMTHTCFSMCGLRWETVSRALS